MEWNHYPTYDTDYTQMYSEPWDLITINHLKDLFVELKRDKDGVPPTYTLRYDHEDPLFSLVSDGQ